jgi:hypothetical protein
LAQQQPANCGYVITTTCLDCSESAKPESYACRALEEDNYCATQDLSGEFQIGTIFHSNQAQGTFAFTPSPMGKRIKHRTVVCAEEWKCMTQAGATTCVPGTVECSFDYDGACSGVELYENGTCGLA